MKRSKGIMSSRSPAFLKKKEKDFKIKEKPKEEKHKEKHKEEKHKEKKSKDLTLTWLNSGRKKKKKKLDSGDRGASAGCRASEAHLRGP